MKKLLILCLTLGFIVLAKQETKAQEYKNAIGGRFGAANGITFKTFLDTDKALDFILNFQNKNDYSYFRLTGLYEIHNPINNADGLRYYYGIGGTVGSRKYKPTDDSQFLLSVDGVLGLDYKFAEAPINVSLDWKPAIELTPDTEFNGEGIGLSLRFTF